MGSNATEANANRTATHLRSATWPPELPPVATWPAIIGQHCPPPSPTAIDEQNPAGDPCRSSLAHRPTLPAENVTKMTYEKRNETRPRAVSY